MTVITSLTRNESGIAAAIEALTARFGAALHRGRAVREQHGSNTTWIPNQAPDAVIYPQSTEDVARIVDICARHRAPVIAFGAGTSLEGHVNAPAGGITLDFRDMDRILAVHDEDMDCVVQPGVTRRRLNNHLRATGLYFPIDPGADASLGGMAATRASGTNAVRHGTMKDNVLALEAVMADGQIIRTAQRARKTAAGYDLTRLLVGSEGTLAIITELTLRLQGRPEAEASAVCSFPTVRAACDAVIMTLQSCIPVARIELLDALSVAAVNAYSALALPESPLLLLDFQGSAAAVREQAQQFGELAEASGGGGFHWSADAAERARLWRARHDVYWAICRLAPHKHSVSTDICVPISRLAEAVVAAQDLARTQGFAAPILGHVGDGNFHVLLLVDGADHAETQRADCFVEALNEIAIGMQGTCTGEHGIGQGKRPYLARELGAATMVMARIKQALDPQAILNPGKVLASS